MEEILKEQQLWEQVEHTQLAPEAKTWSPHSAGTRRFLALLKEADSEAEMTPGPTEKKDTSEACPSSNLMPCKLKM